MFSLLRVAGLVLMAVPVPDADFGISSSWSHRKLGEILHVCKIRLGFAIMMLNWPARAAVCVLDIEL